MAEQEIFGTEKDKINCPFYLKIGSCRHGDRCSRIHHKPAQSQTVIFKNMYDNPAAKLSIVDGFSLEVDEKESQQHIDEFYEDIFLELKKFGSLEVVYVCVNLGEHLNGNVYVKFGNEADAARALMTLQGRYYAGRPIYGELSPVTNFREARCRQFDLGECTRGGYCNFLHFAALSRELEKKLYGEAGMPKGGPPRKPGDERDKDRERDRGSRHRDRDHRDRDRDRERGRDYRDRDRDRDYRDRDYRSRDRERDRDRSPHRRDYPPRDRDEPRREFRERDSYYGPVRDRRDREYRDKDYRRKSRSRSPRRRTPSPPPKSSPRPEDVPKEKQQYAPENVSP